MRYTLLLGAYTTSMQNKAYKATLLPRHYYCYFAVGCKRPIMKYIENLQSHCSGDSFLYLQFACTVSDHGK